MKILLTGSSGFLGKIILKILDQQYQLLRISRTPSSHDYCDLSVSLPALEPVNMIVHAAGKAHSIPTNDQEFAEFWKVNLEGTKNLLSGIEKSGFLPETFVFISTVAVYGLETGDSISEDFPLNGETPYARSKIEAEQVVKDWCTERGVKYVILRLPLVAGPDAPGNLGQIRKAIAGGYYVRIKGNRARKSVVLAEDVARLLPDLSGKQGIYNLTDGIHPFFSEIENALSREVGKVIRLSMPLFILKWAARVGDWLPFFPVNSLKLKKMTSSLTFNDEKARRELGWSPRAAFPV
jgi:nucleoside-diphosphate-sugar epimerase